jgi:transcriptional regulator with XRE-family HTH domain
MEKNKVCPVERGRPRQPSQVDHHVGTRIRLCRTALGLSREHLSAQLSVTHQQVQKYESGVNRISASRLFEISRLLQVPVQYFFDHIGAEIESEGLPGPRRNRDGRTQQGEALRALMDELLVSRETHALVRSYYSIFALTTRRRTLDLINDLALAEADRHIQETSGEPHAPEGGDEAKACLDVG